MKLVQAFAGGEELKSLDKFCTTLGLNATVDVHRRRQARPWERTASGAERFVAGHQDLFATRPNPAPRPDEVAAMRELGEVLRAALDSDRYARAAFTHLRNGDITERELGPRGFTSYKLRQGLRSVRWALTRAGFTCDDLVEALRGLSSIEWDEILGARRSESLAG